MRGRLRDRTFTQIACIAALVLALCGTAHTEEIAVGNFGVPANGIPFRVAHVKGFVKEEGANVTGIITWAGGGTSLRTMLAGSVPYGQVNPGRRPETDLRQCPHDGGIRGGGAPGFSNQIDRRHNGHVIVAVTFLLTVFAAAVSGILLAIDRRLHRWS